MSWPEATTEKLAGVQQLLMLVGNMSWLEATIEKLVGVQQLLMMAKMG